MLRIKTYVPPWGAIEGTLDDVEIVLEITPASGGGVFLRASLPFEALTEEKESAVRSSVAVCQTSDETVVFAGSQALREAQNVEFDASCGEPAYREILRFSRTFICKATEERVEATLRFRKVDDQRSNPP